MFEEQQQQLPFAPRVALGVAALLLALAGAAFWHGPSRAPVSAPRHQAATPLLARLPGAPLPEVRAEAVAVVRLRGDEVLFAKNAEARLPIASITKLMTALVFADAVEPLTPVAISDSAKRVGEEDEKRSSLPAGERVKAEDLLKLLIISSDGDAAYAAAEYLGGMDAPERMLFQEKIARFVERMNTRAREMGLANTRFANPSGMDGPENFSSTTDLVRIAREITERHPELWSMSRTQESFIFGGTGKRYGVVNTNPLLAEFPAIYGSKTGFEDKAKGALLMLYQLAPDERIAIVLLRSPDRFADGRALIQWIENSFAIAPR